MVTVYALQQLTVVQLLVKVVYKLYHADPLRHMLILCPDEEARDMWDKSLWTFHPLAFIPHGCDHEKNASSQPVLLSCTMTLSNNPRILITNDVQRVKDWNIFLKYIVIAQQQELGGVLSKIPQTLEKKCFIEENGKWKEK